MFLTLLKRLSHRIRISLGLEEMKADLHMLHQTILQNYVAKELRENKKYQNKKRLNLYEYKVYSQFGEDGIIDEIFKRIGATNNFFVEIGAGDGTENNTLHLLTKNWKGVWIEADKKHTISISENFQQFLNKKKLTVKQAFVTAENIIELLKNTRVPNEFDLLSIDIDGNDYWIWKTLRDYKPRAIVIEYNASLGPTAKWVMKYDKKHMYDQTNYFGASLKSLEQLGKQLGYVLVGCSFAGANAFFVKRELVKDNFLTPYSSENFYEPPKYFTYFKNGHQKSAKVFKDFSVEK